VRVHVRVCVWCHIDNSRAALSAEQIILASEIDFLLPLDSCCKCSFSVVDEEMMRLEDNKASALRFFIDLALLIAQQEGHLACRKCSTMLTPIHLEKAIKTEVIVDWLSIEQPSQPFIFSGMLITDNFFWKVTVIV